MEWQNIIVAAVGVAVLIYLIRRIYCAVKRKMYNPCASCGKSCPLRNVKKHDK